jgi:ATP-binding cassette subfamily C protein
MHEVILALPDGYETPVSAGAVELSAGQRQRVGLARALYGDPFLLVLDEANSNLDAAGDAALAVAIAGVKERGGIVIMITHRPATLGPATHLAVINAGRLSDFGPRDEVLQRMQTQNAPGQNAQVPADAARPAADGKPADSGNKEAMA